MNGRTSGFATGFLGPRMERDRVAERVSELRSLFEQADEVTFSQVRSDGRFVFLGDEETDRLTGQATLGAEVLVLLDELNLFDLEKVPELGRSRIWGPHLVHPTDATRIYPWVMGGEPCLVDTRIPTSTLFALSEERALGEAAIARLYPGLSTERVSDAIQLERALLAGDRALVA